MKRNWKQVGFGLLLLSPGLLFGQYQIDWSAFGAGGAASTGGVYAVAATVGQSGIGVARGGPFFLSSGYWAMIGFLPTPEAPRLDFTRIGNTLEIWWPLSAPLVLMEAEELDGPWTEVPYPYTTNGSRVSVSLPLPGPALPVHAAGEIRIPAKKVVKAILTR